MSPQAKTPVRARHVVGSTAHVPALVEDEAELAHDAVPLRADESERQQHEVGRELLERVPSTGSKRPSTRRTVSAASAATSPPPPSRNDEVASE